MRGDRLRARIADELDAIDAHYAELTRSTLEERSMRDVAQKLRRLLYIVPYVAKHPEGVPVEQLAKMLGAERDELLADLDLLSQVGPPDGDPGEYLLVSVDEGRVFVDLAHRLTRPLRLTPAEGCSLLLGIRALRESGIAPFDAAMQSAEKKLLTALGRDAGEAREPRDQHGRRRARRRGREPPARAGHRGAHAASASRSTTPRPRARQAERRPIDPYGIVHHAGEWYVVGHCHKRGDVRTFRIDRIAALHTTGERFERPADFDLEAYRRERLYVPSADSVTVRVQLDAARGHPDRRELAGRRGHDAGRRLGRAARRLRRLRVGHRLGARPRPPRLDRRPRARRAPRCATGSPACAPSSPRSRAIQEIF